MGAISTKMLPLKRQNGGTSLGDRDPTLRWDDNSKHPNPNNDFTIPVPTMQKRPRAAQAVFVWVGAGIVKSQAIVAASITNLYRASLLTTLVQASFTSSALMI